MDFSSWCYNIVNHKDSRQRIKLNELANTRDGSLVMEYSLIRRFLESLERNFQKERRYDLGMELKPKMDKSRLKKLLLPRS